MNRGLSFISTFTLGRDIKKQFKSDLEKYHRRLKLISFFKDKESVSLPFVGQSVWTPPPEEIQHSVHQLITLDKLTIKNHYRTILETPNISQLEKEALTELQKNKHIVIKPADKRSAVVILDRDQYILEVERQLNDTIYYHKLDKPIYLDTIKLVIQIIDIGVFLPGTILHYRATCS